MHNYSLKLILLSNFTKNYDIFVVNCLEMNTKLTVFTNDSRNVSANFLQLHLVVLQKATSKCPEGPLLLKGKET